MLKDLTQTISAALQKRASADGGFKTHPNGKSRADATAWATYALASLDPKEPLVKKGRRKLSSLQLPDGRVPLTPETPRSWWPTSVALLAWHGDDDFFEEQAQAVKFLLNHGGTIYKTKIPFLEHNTSLQGWGWIEDTYSWVEPTSLAIIALKTLGKGDHPRVSEAIALLLDRELEEGGWNFGNKKVFGSKLFPMPETTGMALCALKGYATQQEIEKSLAYLQGEYLKLKTPLSLAWAILGLSSFDITLTNPISRIESCFDFQKKYGHYDTMILSQLGWALSGLTTREGC
jgi:hypothetical protein